MPKKLPEFQNFGEYLYYAYANLQMLHYALKADKPKYDRMCYMIRAKAFKAYKEWRWTIHNQLIIGQISLRIKTITTATKRYILK